MRRRRWHPSTGRREPESIRSLTLANDDPQGASAQACDTITYPGAKRASRRSRPTHLSLVRRRSVSGVCRRARSGS